MGYTIYANISALRGEHGEMALIVQDRSSNGSPDYDCECIAVGKDADQLKAYLVDNYFGHRVEPATKVQSDNWSFKIKGVGADVGGVMKAFFNAIEKPIDILKENQNAIAKEQYKYQERGTTSGFVNAWQAMTGKDNRNLFDRFCQHKTQQQVLVVDDVEEAKILDDMFRGENIQNYLSDRIKNDIDDLRNWLGYNMQGYCAPERVFEDIRFYRLAKPELLAQHVDEIKKAIHDMAAGKLLNSRYETIDVNSRMFVVPFMRQELFRDPNTMEIEVKNVYQDMAIWDKLPAEIIGNNSLSNPNFDGDLETCAILLSRAISNGDVMDHEYISTKIMDYPQLWDALSQMDSFTVGNQTINPQEIIKAFSPYVPSLNADLTLEEKTLLRNMEIELIDDGFPEFTEMTYVVRGVPGVSEVYVAPEDGMWGIRDAVIQEYRGNNNQIEQGMSTIKDMVKQYAELPTTQATLKSMMSLAGLHLDGDKIHIETPDGKKYSPADYPYKDNLADSLKMVIQSVESAAKLEQSRDKHVEYSLNKENDKKTKQVDFGMDR